MLELIAIILLLGIFGKVFGFAIRMAWSVTKIFFTVIFFPLILVGLILSGLVYLALPILLIVGVIVLAKSIVV